MGTQYIVDTNVLIDAQMKRLPSNGLIFLAKAINSDFIISFITQIEYLGYKNISKESEEFISLADVIWIDQHIIEKSIEIRKNHKIKLPDAIIAATALTRGLILVTHNEDDFVGVHDLMLINPYLL